MDREQFHCLYINVNSLLELSIKRLGAEILSRPVEPDTTMADLSPEEIEAQIAARFNTMDMSALDGIDYDFFSAPRTPGGTPEIPASELAFDHSARQGPPGDDEAPDLSTYMERAYGFAAELQQRIDAALHRADLDAIAAALGKLPQSLPLLTQRLSGDEMGQWLDAERAQPDGLSELVIEIRKLEVS